MFPIADLFRLRPRNIRTRLLRDLTLVILLTSGAVVALALSSPSNAERSKAGLLDSKLVAAVQCERSSEPVFLKGKNKEAFYIRSGPSSVELSPREVLDYVARRA